MAAEPIKGSQIVQPGALDDFQKEIKETIGLLDELTEALKKNIKASNEAAQAGEKAFDNVDEIEATEEAIKDTKKAVEELNKVEKERIKLEQRLQDLNKEEVQRNIELKEQLKEQTRLARQQAKERLGLVSIYQQESKRLNDLRKQYKDLVLQGGENTKQAKELLKAIKSLDEELKELDDTVGQNFRSIGKYENATKKLNNSLKKTGIAAAAFFAIQKGTEILNQNREAQEATEKALGRLTITLSVFINRTIKALPTIGDLIKDTFKDIGQSISTFFLEIQRGFLDSINVIGNFDDKIKELDKSIEDSSKAGERSGKTWEDLAKIYEGTGDEIEKLIGINDKLIEDTTKFTREANKLTKELAVLEGQQERLSVASDDNTTTLEAQIAITEELRKKQEEINELNIKIAKNNEDLARRRAIVLKGNLEAETELANAIAARIQAETQRDVQRLETLRQQREIERDLFEQELDILLDVSDRRKTINEGIAADESESLETRRKALEKSIIDIENSFRKQVALVQGQTKELINIDDLLSIEDTRELNNRIRDLGLGEIEINRLREIIIERLQATRDFEQAQKDLNKTFEEADELEAKILLQEDALFRLRQEGADAAKVLERLEEDNLKNDIANLEFRLALAKEGSEERLQIQFDLNEKLLEQQQKANEKQLEEEKKQLEKSAELQRAGLQVTRGILEKRNEEQLNRVDELIDKEEERANELRELARQGIVDAENNLATQQQRQAQLEVERERLIQRQKREQLALAAIETYNSFIAAGETPQQALVKTPTAIQTLDAIIDLLPIFHEGTKETIAEDVGRNIGYLGNNEYLTVTQGGEKIFSEADSALIPKDMSNHEVALAAINHKYTSGNIGFDDSMLRESLLGVKKAIEDKPILSDLKVDDLTKYLVATIERKGKRTKKYYS